MEFKIEKQPGSLVEATVVFDKGEWDSAKQKAFKKLAKNVEIKGFRKGQAPDNLVRAQLKPEAITNEAVDSLLQPAYDKLLQDHSIRPILRPDVKLGAMTEDGITIIFTVTEAPTVKVGAYKGLTVEIPAAKATEADVDAELKKLQESQSMLMIKEGVVEAGNTVVMDFEGFVDGQPFDGGKAEKYELEVGSGSFIPGFEDQLLGLTVNLPAEVNVKFPENYVKELAGKAATFKVLIHEIKEKIIPDINDDLALSANLEDVTTLDQLKAHLAGQVEHQKAHAAEHEAEGKLMDLIVSASEIELPVKVVEAETDRALEDFKNRVQQQGLTFEQYMEITQSTPESVRDQIKVDAEKNLRQLFVRQEIIKLEGLTVTSEEIEGEYERIAAQYKMTVQQVKDALKDRVHELEDDILNHKAIHYLVSVNTIKTV